MYAIVYIDPSDGEPVAAFGPFASSEAADEAFESIRDDRPHPEWARTILLAAS